MKTVLIANANGGNNLNFLIDTDKANKSYIVISGLSDNEGIKVEEYHKEFFTVEKQDSKWNDKLKKYEYFDASYESYNDKKDFTKIFDSLEKVLNFLEKDYNLKLTWEPLTKELTEQWTIEQKIANSNRTGNKNERLRSYHAIEKMHKNQDVKIIEVELIKYLKENPKTSTKDLQKLFEGGSSEDFEYSILSRLCHDYGKPESPLIMQESGLEKKDP